LSDALLLDKLFKCMNHLLLRLTDDGVQRSPLNGPNIRGLQAELSNSNRLDANVLSVNVPGSSEERIETVLVIP
jgi:hypothetical protein